MAFSRDRSSFLSRLRPRQTMDSSNFTSRPVLPMDIWNYLDEFSGTSRAQIAPRSRGSLVYEVHDIDRFFTDWLWIPNRGREPEVKPPERVDTTAVLRKCRKVVHKPNSSLWGKAKSEADQSECPVCLEKLVAKDKLLLLPCKHQFHVDCLTPWIKHNHACCPCCRADILAGPEKDEKTRESIMSFRPWRNMRGSDLRNDGAASSQRNESTASGQSNRNHSNDSNGEDTDAWEGLHEYIMAALAEVDAELNRIMH